MVLARPLRAPLSRFLPQLARSLAGSSTINIFCASCTAHLYQYRKRGKGALVKCLESRILADHTAGDMACHQCGATFARRFSYKGQPAQKIVGGKVYHK